MKKIILLCGSLFLLAAMLTIFRMAGCQIFKQATIKLVVFHDPKTTHKLFINGRPLSEFERNAPDPYAEDFRIYDDKRVVLQIKSEENNLDEQTIQEGTYVINLSKNHTVSYQEISYGRTCASCKSGNIKGLGVAKLSDESDALPYNFNAEPPLEIKGRNINSLRDRQFFTLRAF